MSKIFLTSDLHFNHANITKFEPESRPFATIEEMNQALIFNWNSVVSPEDDVYVLGDFFMGQISGIDDILPQLKGHIHLIRGNHDTKNRLEKYQQYGIDVKEIEYLTYKGRFFILCHFPIASEEFKQMVRKDNNEVVICYGHIHSNAPHGYVDGTYHIGVDTNGLTPVNLQQIWEESWPKPEDTSQFVEDYKEAHKNDAINSTRCDKCIHSVGTCGQEPESCKRYRRDPPDGGYYG